MVIILYSFNRHIDGYNTVFMRHIDGYNTVFI